MRPLAAKTPSPSGAPHDDKEIVRRARARSKEILRAQYETGRKTIERHQWAQQAFRDLHAQCPDVDEADVVRLFRDKRMEDVPRIALDVRFLQYNATHRNER